MNIVFTYIYMTYFNLFNNLENNAPTTTKLKCLNANNFNNTDV